MCVTINGEERMDVRGGGRPSQIDARYLELYALAEM